MIEAGKKVIRIILNIMQLLLEFASQRIRVVQCGRGSGKSFAVALEIKSVVLDMPRSKNFILAETYQQALTRTLPSTIKGLALLGWHKDIHYFVGRYPPKSWKWPEAYEPPLDPKHSIFFYNGTVYDLLSQDTNSRGGNYSSGIVDEAQDIDEAKFMSQVIPTMRAEYQRFKKKRTYRRLTLLCSMPRIKRAEWIFNYEKLAREHPKEYLFISAPSKVNKHNLPPGWFKDQRRILTKSEYDIEIGNIRPKKIEGGFYPFFDDKVHSYVSYNNDYLNSLIDDKKGYNIEAFENMDCRQDGDIIPDAPLEISMDYGGWFNGIVTEQESHDGREFRFLSAMSIDEKKSFESLMEGWCSYYRPHKNKVVTYWYDQTAKGKDPRVDEYYVEVPKILRSFGWVVIEMDIGAQPSHDDRYRFFKIVHGGQSPDVPTFLYNRNNCKWLIISINNADMVQGRNGIEKKKVDEKNHEIDQRTTTHFSDAHDTVGIGKYGDRLKERGSMMPARIGSR